MSAAELRSALVEIGGDLRMVDSVQHFGAKVTAQAEVCESERTEGVADSELYQRGP